MRIGHHNDPTVDHDKDLSMVVSMSRNAQPCDYLSRRN